jgi:hypothetical protein
MWALFVLIVKSILSFFAGIGLGVLLGTLIYPFIS